VRSSAPPAQIDDGQCAWDLGSVEYRFEVWNDEITVTSQNGIKNGF
jgi:hypothetical protein